MNAKGINPDGPIFMIGMARSGTSIISEAVSLHEELGWISNYLNRFPSITGFAALNRVSDLPGIGRSLRGHKKQSRGVSTAIRRCLPYATEAYPFWSRFFGERFSWNYLAGEEATREQGESAREAVGRILRYQGKKRLFAKFTGPPRMHFLGSVFPEAFYIQIIRDPRAVASSLLQVPFWREGGGLEKPWWEGLPDAYIQEWRERGQTPAALAAVQWKRVLELVHEESKSVAPGRYLEIRYEDFVRRPHESLSRVFSWAGLSDSERAHRYLESEGRLVDKNHKFKTVLNSEDLDAIRLITGELAGRFGYDLA